MVCLLLNLFRLQCYIYCTINDFWNRMTSGRLVSFFFFLTISSYFYISELNTILIRIVKIRIITELNVSNLCFFCFCFCFCFFFFAVCFLEKYFYRSIFHRSLVVSGLVARSPILCSLCVMMA